MPVPSRDAESVGGEAALAARSRSIFRTRKIAATRVARKAVRRKSGRV
jgi:hypothetical protein